MVQSQQPGECIAKLSEGTVNGGNLDNYSSPFSKDF